MSSLKELILYLESKDNIWLYGAGIVAKRIILLCKHYKINVAGIIVSERGDNSSLLDGVTVYSLDELKYKKTKLNDLNHINKL